MSGKSDSKSFKIGRNAENGHLVPVEYARAHPQNHVVEHMPKPGRGDTDKSKKR